MITVMQNEYGLAAWKAILGIEILNEGGGLSVDDITNEEQTTYVARAATAWVPIAPAGTADENKIGQIFTGAGAPTPGTTSVVPAGSGTTIDDYKTYLGISET